MSRDKLLEYPENLRNLFGEHELFPRTPLRQWMRLHVPSPEQGYVVEDLDLIYLRYGKPIRRGKKADGQFILCEWKLRKRFMDYSQERVFGLIDRLLRLADPTGIYYQGFYLITWGGTSNLLWINKSKITQLQFQSFLFGEFHIEPYRFDIYTKAGEAENAS